MMVDINSLIEAFRSVEDSVEASLRLTKQAETGYPILALSATLLSGIQILHEVLIVKLLSQASVRETSEPRLPPPESCLEFTDFKVLKRKLESMQILDKEVGLTFNVNNQNSLMISLENGDVSMKTYFRNLESALHQDSQLEELAVTLKTKDVLNALQFIQFFQSVTCERLLISVIRNKAVVIFVSLNSDLGSLTYFIPLVQLVY